MPIIEEQIPFDPEGSGYDDATYERYGYTPTLGADGKMHKQSRSPEAGGLILKGRKHETYHLTVKGEEEAGHEIYKNEEDGRYYSRPIIPEKDIFDKFAQEEKRDIFSIMALNKGPADPAEPPVGYPLEPEEWQNNTRGALNIFKKGLWGGLGIIGWPFERLEYSIATPVTTILEERRETLAERGVSHGFGMITPRLIRSEDALREGKAVVESLGLVGRAWASGKTPPEGIKTFNDLFGSYYESLTGEPAAGWYKAISGTGTSILVTPFLFGKILRGIAKGAKATGIPARIAARRLPAWQAMKTLAKAEAGAKASDARALGKSLGNHQIKRLARELSEKTGRDITSRAVKLRLTQLVKGGITTRPELAAKANPVIESFVRTSAELKELGILPEYTYLSKLPRKEIANLLREKAVLQKQIPKLKQPAYQKTLRDMAQQIHVKGKPTLANRILNLAQKAEEGDLPYIKQLAKFLDVNEAQLANIRVVGRNKAVQDLWKIISDMNRNDPKLLSQLEKVLEVKTTQPGRLSRLVESFENARQLERTKIMKSVGKAADKLLSVDIAGINTSKLGPYANRLLQLREKEGSRIVDELLNIGIKVEGLDVAGLKPLLSKIGKMQRRFPGQAQKIAETQAKIDKITQRVRTSYREGGTKYFPRMYLSKEEETAARKAPLYAANRIRAKYALERKKIPEDVRKAMGEIKEPAFPIVKRLIQEGNDIEMTKLFNFAAANPKWVGSEWRLGLARKALPDTKAYGALRGKFVAPRIYDDVTSLIKTKGEVEAIYDSFIGYWKIGKVVFNPATHFRNMFSNSILLDLSGMDHLQQAKYMTKALSHIKKGSEEYQTAKKFFMRTTLVKGELFDDMLKTIKETKGDSLSRIINSTNRFVAKGAKGPAEVYQAEEFIGKFMKYLQMREQGLSTLDAVNEANKWLFDYGDLALWEKKIARRIMPFYTFPRKALPRVLEAAANRPLVLAKYPMLAKSMTQFSLYRLDIKDKDWAYIQEDLPSYMQNGSYILMPYRDKNGDLRFFDWTYIVPWGELFDAQERGLLKTGITNPLFQLVSDIRVNKSGWTGRQIYDDAIPPEKQTDAYRREQNLKKMLYVWQGLVPSLTYKGIYWDKLYGAATGKKARGKDMLLPEAIAHTLFGMRTQAIDPTEIRRWKLLEMTEGFDELRGNMSKILIQKSRGDITDKEFDKKWEIYSDQLQFFHSGAITEDDNLPTVEEMLDVMDDLVDEPIVEKE